MFDISCGNITYAFFSFTEISLILKSTEDRAILNAPYTLICTAIKASNLEGNITVFKRQKPAACFRQDMVKCSLCSSLSLPVGIKATCGSGTKHYSINRSYEVTIERVMEIDLGTWTCSLDNPQLSTSFELERKL